MEFGPTLPAPAGLVRGTGRTDLAPPWFAAVVFGLGALTVTIWRARSTGQTATAPA
jgi:hypothetical protein